MKKTFETLLLLMSLCGTACGQYMLARDDITVLKDPPQQMMRDYSQKFSVS